MAPPADLSRPLTAKGRMLSLCMPQCLAQTTHPINVCEKVIRGRGKKKTEWRDG